jgi:hypothetical protein
MACHWRANARRPHGKDLHVAENAGATGWLYRMRVLIARSLHPLQSKRPRGASWSRAALFVRRQGIGLRERLTSNRIHHGRRSANQELRTELRALKTRRIFVTEIRGESRAAEASKGASRNLTEPRIMRQPNVCCRHPAEPVLGVRQQHGRYFACRARSVWTRYWLGQQWRSPTST